MNPFAFAFRPLHSNLLRSIVVGAALFAVGGSAFAASNTVPVSTAGEGSAVTSGYTVTSVAYTLNGSTPSNIDTVTFVATADNSSTAGSLSAIKSRFDASASYYSCTRSGGAAPAHNISCDTTAGTQLTVSDADTVDIIIVE